MTGWNGWMNKSVKDDSFVLAICYRPMRMTCFLNNEIDILAFVGNTSCSRDYFNQATEELV